MANLSCFCLLLEFAESLKSQTIQKVDRPSKKKRNGKMNKVREYALIAQLLTKYI